MTRSPPILLVLLAAVSITACRSVVHYQEPHAGPVATVTIRTLTTDHFNIGVVSYRGSEYLESRGDTVTVLNSKAVGYSFTDHVVIKVAAAQAFRFSTKVGGNEVAGPGTMRGMACMTHSSFVPEAGVNYLVEHDATRDGCRVVLWRVDLAGGKTVDPGLKALKWCLDPWLTGNAFLDDYCKEGFKYE
jgi:hypothetical protein